MLLAYSYGSVTLPNLHTSNCAQNHFSVGERFGGISNTRQGASCSIDGRIDVLFGQGTEPCGGGRGLWGAPTTGEQGGAGGGVRGFELH